MTCLVCTFFGAACNQPGDREEITETFERSEHTRVPRVMATSEERLAREMPRTAPPAQPTVAVDPLFDYDMPEGWTESAPTQFRNLNFLAGPSGEVECYVSVLPGDAGGLLSNANRWRGQMGQEPYTEDQFWELARTIILDHEAVIVDFEGTFTGMGQAAPQEGYRLVGALIETADSGVFVKMVGPNDATLAQQDNFALFVQTLKFIGSDAPEAVAQESQAESGTLPAGHPDVGASTESALAASTPASSGDGFKWVVPPGWSVVDYPSPMRLVTMSFGESNEGECYVVVLDGNGGGRLSNMNRWLGQMGAPPLDATEIPLQPKTELFGMEVPLLVIEGTYSGMGGAPKPNTVLYGTIAEIEDKSVFIKLIAPKAVAEANYGKFIGFCWNFEYE